MPRVIEVLVRPDGQVSVQTKGYAGSACVHASRYLEEALGIREQEQKTSEYHVAEPVCEQVRQ